MQLHTLPYTRAVLSHKTDTMKRLIHYSGLLLLIISFQACNLSEKNRMYGEGDTALQNSYWILLSLQDQQFKDSPETHTAYIRFEEGGNRLTGFTGCNRLMGSYSAAEGIIQFSDLSSTRAMCPIIEQETQLLDVLEKADTYRIAGEVLTLFYQNQAVATFRAGSEPNLPELP